MRCMGKSLGLSAKTEDSLPSTCLEPGPRFWQNHGPRHKCPPGLHLACAAASRKKKKGVRARRRLPVFRFAPPNVPQKKFCYVLQCRFARVRVMERRQPRHRAHTYPRRKGARWPGPGRSDAGCLVVEPATCGAAAVRTARRAYTPLALQIHGASPTRGAASDQSSSCDPPWGQARSGRLLSGPLPLLVLPWPGLGRFRIRGLRGPPARP